MLPDHFTPLPLPLLLMSAFIDWQAGRREITPAELEALHPGTLETFGFDEAPPEVIYSYPGEVWITRNRDGSGPYFWLCLESEEFTSTELDQLEQRLHLWSLDEAGEL
jgi:hypothetical protein